MTKTEKLRQDTLLAVTKLQERTTHSFTTNPKHPAPPIAQLHGAHNEVIAFLASLVEYVTTLSVRITELEDQLENK